MDPQDNLVKPVTGATHNTVIDLIDSKHKIMQIFAVIASCNHSDHLFACIATVRC